MIGTIINQLNSEMFLAAIPENILPYSDIKIGVIDEESDTACGVLTAEVIGRHSLAIRYIYVDKNSRLMGAGSELVKTLIDVAEEIEIESIVCSHARGNISDGIVELLESCGFARDDEMTEPIYGVSVSVISIPGDISKAFKSEGVILKPLAVLDDKKWQVGGIVWERNHGPSFGTLAFSQKMDDFDRNMSFVALDKNDEIVGMLLGVCSEKGYELKTLTALGEKAPSILYMLIDYATDAIREAFGEDAMVIIRPEKKESIGILERICEGAYITLGETVQYTYEVMI